MKTGHCLLLFSVVTALSIIPSCMRVNDEPAVMPTEEFVTISAIVEDDLATRTYLTGVRVKWEMTDTIALWYGSLGESMDDEPYSVLSIDSQDARKATFGGFAPLRHCYMGVYPYIACSGCSKDGKLMVSLPTEQIATPDSFGPGANVAVAFSETTDLSFKNIGGLVAIGLTEVGNHIIKSIRLTGTSPLSGNVEITQAGLPAISEVTEGVDYVELTGTFAVRNTYYFVVLPGTHSHLAITLTDTDGATASAISDYGFTIERKSNSFVADISVSEEDWTDTPVAVEEKIVLNEYCGHGRKYIELFNAGENTVSLTDWKLFLDEGSGAVWTGSSESLASHEYLILFSDENYDPYPNPEGSVTFGGDISADKNHLAQLYDNNNTLKDSFQRGEKSTGWGTVNLPEHGDASFSRVPDGDGDWKYALPTEGAANGGKSGTIEHYPAANGVIRLNEINGNDKFIEIFSTATDHKISLEDMTIQKDGGIVWTGAAGSFIEPGGYVLLFSKDAAAAGDRNSKFTLTCGLSASCPVRIQLFDAEGNILDIFNYSGYSGTPAPASYGRNSNGTWHYQDATPGAENIDGTVVMSGLDALPIMGEVTYSIVLDGISELSGLCLSKDNDFFWGAADPGILYQLDFDGSRTIQWMGGGDMEGMAIDPVSGDLYISCEPGTVKKTSAPGYGRADVAFSIPEATGLGNSGAEGITWYKGDLYLGLQKKATLLKYSISGTKLAEELSLTTLAPTIKEIAGLSYDPISDYLWVLDSEKFTLFLFKGDASELLATYYIGDFATSNPEAVCVDRKRGCLWIVEDCEVSSILHKLPFENL